MGEEIAAQANDYACKERKGDNVTQSLAVCESLFSAKASRIGFRKAIEQIDIDSKNENHFNAYDSHTSQVAVDHHILFENVRYEHQDSQYSTFRCNVVQILSFHTLIIFMFSTTNIVKFSKFKSSLSEGRYLRTVKLPSRVAFES